MCLCITNGFAHDANKAFFKIQQKDSVVEVQAEFPWSVRNAVLNAFPELENSNLQSDFDDAFFKYITTNLKISNGEEFLPLVSVKAVKFEGHSHQNNFVIVYAGNNFNTITNTLMFNIYNNQKNYHNVLIENKAIEYQTTLKTTSFNITDTTKQNTNTTIYLSLVIVFGLLFLGYKFIKK